MKIFIVQSHIGGGGAERVGVLIAGGLAQRGHEVYLVTNLHDEVKYHVDEKVKILNMVTSPRNKLTKWVSALKNLRRYVKQYQPDVIIGIMQLSSFISKLACLGMKTPVIATEHYSFDMKPFKRMNAIEFFSKFYLNRIYEHVTVLTEEDKRVIGNRLKHVSVMPNPLALHPIKLNSNDFNQRERIIVAAGRIDAWYYKGFDVLIKAWGNLMKNEGCRMKNANWRLQIAGTGSEVSLNYLKRLCKENGVEDSVEFLGFVSDMESLYKKASVFVLSSRYEGFGLVLIEAMSQGCACIACDHKGRQREIFGKMKNERIEILKSGSVEAGENGILCPPDDVEALATAMRKMIDDDEYREYVRVHAIQRSCCYSVSNIAIFWNNLIYIVKSGKQ